MSDDGARAVSVHPNFRGMNALNALTCLMEAIPSSRPVRFRAVDCGAFGVEWQAWPVPERKRGG